MKEENSMNEQTVSSVKEKKKNAVAVGASAFFHGKTWKKIVKNRMLYLFLIPALILVAIFYYGPMFGLLMSFQDYTLKEGVLGSEWVGFKWFIQSFTDSSSLVLAYEPIKNTLYISFIKILTNFPIILIYTLLLNEVKNRRLKGAVQTVSYIPYFISWVAVGGMAFNLFNIDDGFINKLLVKIGGESAAINWYESPDYWWVILAFSALWKNMGWSTLIYMSNLGSIDSELYDACMIDGGGKFRQAITVTLPGLMHVILLQLTLDISGIMKDNADQILALITSSSNSLGHMTTTIGVQEFNTLQGTANYSRVASVGLVRGLIGVVLVHLMDKVTKKTDNGGVL